MDKEPMIAMSNISIIKIAMVSNNKCTWLMA